MRRRDRWGLGSRLGSFCDFLGQSSWGGSREPACRPRDADRMRLAVLPKLVQNALDRTAAQFRGDLAQLLHRASIRAVFVEEGEQLLVSQVTRPLPADRSRFSRISPGEDVLAAARPIEEA